jgi:hypothetical protein
LTRQYPRVDMRGVHFFTATAMYMRENEGIMEFDESGFGPTPIAPNCQETACEWLGIMYLTGVQRMGKGATFAQIHFSAVAQKSLAGGGGGVDPIHLAMFFSQLFHAGKCAQKSLPFVRGNVQEVRGAGIPFPHLPVPAEVLAKIEATALALAPAGVDPDVISKAVNANASKPGTDFRQKQIAGWKLLGQGRIKEGEAGVEATYVIVQSAKQLQRATVTLSVEALMSA